MQTIQVKHLHIIFQGQSAPGALQNVSISYNTKCMLLVTDDEWMSYPNSRFHVFAYSYSIFSAMSKKKKKKKKKGNPFDIPWLVVSWYTITRFPIYEKSQVNFWYQWTLLYPLSWFCLWDWVITTQYSVSKFNEISEVTTAFSWITTQYITCSCLVHC